MARPAVAGDAASTAAVDSEENSHTGLTTGGAATTAAAALCAAVSDPGSGGGEQRDEQLEALRAIADVLGGMVDSLGSRDPGGAEGGGGGADGVIEIGADAPSGIGQQRGAGSGDVERGAEAAAEKVLAAGDVGGATDDKEQVESMGGSGAGTAGAGVEAAAGEGGIRCGGRDGSSTSASTPVCCLGGGGGAARREASLEGSHGSGGSGGGGSGGGGSGHRAFCPGGEPPAADEKQALGGSPGRGCTGAGSEGRADGPTAATADTSVAAGATATLTGSGTDTAAAVAAAGSAAPPSPVLLFPPVEPPPPGLLPVGVVTYNQVGELKGRRAIMMHTCRLSKGSGVGVGARHLCQRASWLGQPHAGERGPGKALLQRSQGLSNIGLVSRLCNMVCSCFATASCPAWRRRRTSRTCWRGRGGCRRAACTPPRPRAGCSSEPSCSSERGAGRAGRHCVPLQWGVNGGAALRKAVGRGPKYSDMKSYNSACRAHAVRGLHIQ